jgi:hypothetical protein
MKKKIIKQMMQIYKLHIKNKKYTADTLLELKKRSLKSLKNEFIILKHFNRE